MVFLYGQHFESMLVGSLWVEDTEEEADEAGFQ